MRQADSNYIPPFITSDSDPGVSRAEDPRRDRASVSRVGRWFDAEDGERGIVANAPIPFEKQLPQTRDEIDSTFDILRISVPARRAEREEKTQAKETTRPLGGGDVWIHR